MANIIHNTRIQLKCDTLANWKKSTVKLLKGEVAFATDTADYRVGTGAAAWKDLVAPSPAVVLNRAPVDSDSGYKPGQLWVDTSDNSRLYILTVTDTWQKFTLYEEYEACMLTEEYVGDTAVKAVKMADSIKANGKYVVVDDNTNKGMWSASNTEKKIKDAKDEAIQEAYDKVVAEKGVADGFASLDSDGKVPAAQLPSYVDDVVEVATYAALPKPGETGKIYIVKAAANDTSLEYSQYRWSGSQYVQITSGNIVVADGSGSAYPNEKGEQNHEVIEAITQAIYSKTFSTFNESAAGLPTNIISRLDALEEFQSTGIKAAAKVDNLAPTNLMVTENYTDLSVTSDKIANENVTTGKLADGAVTAVKIADKSITGLQIADKTITLAKLSTDLQSKLDTTGDSGVTLSEGCISTEMLADGAVTDAKVTSVNWNKLELSSGDTLVLNCGNASS